MSLNAAKRRDTLAGRSLQNASLAGVLLALLPPLASVPGAEPIDFARIPTDEITLRVDSDWVRDVAFSPTGRHLVATGISFSGYWGRRGSLEITGSLKVWDLKTSEPIISVTGGIQLVGFSRDGEFICVRNGTDVLVYGRLDATVRLWNPAELRAKVRQPVYSAPSAQPRIVYPAPKPQLGPVRVNQDNSLIDIIREQQSIHVGESWGTMDYQGFTDHDLQMFRQMNTVSEITASLRNDPEFGKVVNQIKQMSPSQQSRLLSRAAATYKPTWRQQGHISRSGQTTAGQTAERLVAQAIAGLVRDMLKQ